MLACTSQIWIGGKRKRGEGEERRKEVGVEGSGKEGEKRERVGGRVKRGKEGKEGGGKREYSSL